jgi:hypothetical protein
MRESFWGIMIVVMGITSMFLVYFFQSITNTSDHNYELLKETTQAAMFDSLDLAAYRYDGTVRIDRELFVESFLRRFAQDATLQHQYHVTIYDVYENPPKVSIKITTMGSETSTTINNQSVSFQLTHKIDAILETKY